MDFRSFISHVFAGLDEEYNPIICVIWSQDLTWNKIQYKLLSYEQRHEKLQEFKGSLTLNQPTLNYAAVDKK